MHRRDLSKLFQSCAVANLILFFGLLTTGRLYIDDIGRSMRGYSNWTELGARPLADVFIWIINLGHPLVNTFPLPQLISICFIAVAGVALAKAFSVESRSMAAICTLPLAGQPYFLENMSYAFDSPFMALAMMLSVLAAVRLFTPRRYAFLQGIAMLFVSLNLYQAGIGIFFVICLVLMVHHLESADRPLKYSLFSLCRAGAAAVIALLLYMPVTKIFEMSPYVEIHDKIAGPSNGIAVFLTNAHTYLQTLWSDWSGNIVGYVFMGVFLSTVIVAMLRTTMSARRKTSLEAVVCPVIVLVALSLTWLASYFPQLLLEQPKWAPRTFSGFGGVLACCSLYIYAHLKHAKLKAIPLRHVAAGISCILAFCITTFAYAFTKANTEQMYYEDAVLTRIADDIETLDDKGNLKYLSYIGRMEKNPLLQNTQKKFPLIGRLVPIHLKDNWIWGYRQLTYEGISALEWKQVTPEDKASILNGQLSQRISNRTYSIHVVNGDQLIIRFHGEADDVDKAAGY